MDLTDVYRAEYGRCVATLVRLLGDINLAEEAVQDAF
ncbi:MAG: polymerase sigma-70 factor, subfamily, partial [Micromonosporaceae bacterium]|nr:polymerase sigma-70 factor, subfamily [Micromonosporaceae bacterium]